MLNPWFVTGFTDGEGCFSLYVRADKQKRKNTIATYYRWQVDFAFTLRGDDIKVLESIKDYFGCGTVSLSKTNNAINKIHSYGLCGYHVVVPNDLIEKVFPHFEKYPLESKKQKDFELWKQAVVIIKNAKDRKKSLFDKISYTQDENQFLVDILNKLKSRITGGHLTQKGIDFKLQGEKEVVQVLEKKDNFQNV